MLLEEINDSLSNGPYIVNGGELKTLLLNNIEIVEDPITFDILLDDPNYIIPPNKLIIKGCKGRISRRIPFLNLNIKLPDRITLNKIISDRFNLAKSLLLNHLVLVLHKLNRSICLNVLEGYKLQ